MIRYAMLAAGGAMREEKREKCGGIKARMMDSLVVALRRCSWIVKYITGGLERMNGVKGGLIETNFGRCVRCLKFPRERPVSGFCRRRLL